MKTRDTEYLYATTRIRSLEKGLLDRSATDRLVEATGIEDMAKIMSELGYPNLQVAGVREIENSLMAARKETFSLIADISPKSEICEIFRIRYDYHNIKAILKSMEIGENPEELLIDAGRFAPNFLITALREMDYRELPKDVSSAIEDARETLSRTSDPQIFDFILDRAYFEEIRTLAKKADSKFLDGYVKCLIDAANLRATIRSIRQVKESDFLSNALQSGGNIPKDKFLSALSGEVSLADALKGTFLEAAAEKADVSGSLVAFERECDDAIMSYLHSARYVAFGEEPIVAYVAAREADIMTIRIILAGKLQDLPHDEIRERLRASYV